MTQPSAGFAFELLERERVLVSYAGPYETCPEAWNRYLDLMAARIEPTMRFMVIHEGPAPSIRDQQRIGSLARPHRPLVAMISSSNALRFAASAFALINKRFRFFHPDDLPSAFAHLELREWEQPEVERCIARLKAQVDDG